MVTTSFPPPPGPLKGLLSLSCMEDYFVIEFPVCGGEIGSLDDIVLVPFSNHVAKALRVLVLFEHTSVHTAPAMMCDIHQARDCVDTVYVAF